MTDKQRNFIENIDDYNLSKRRNKMINKDGKLICPHCHCVLKQENFVLTSYPVQFQYYCPKCNYYTTSYTNGLGEIK